MAEFHRLPDAAHVEREASEWIARLEADDVSEQDRKRFGAWRGAHSLHARVFDELHSRWREFEAAGPLVRAVSFGQSMINAGTPRVRLRWPLAAAASVVAVIGLGSWLGTRGAPEIFRTAIGEHATVTLADGSIVELNSNTLARLELSKLSRTIRLERGEAYFQVAHDTARPFWVVADGSYVRAVGTAFNVDIRPSGLRVTVSEGAVKVGEAAPRGPQTRNLDDEGSATTLAAGEQVDMRGGAVAVRTLNPSDLARSTGWRTGTLYFEDEPLGDVVAEMNRYMTVRIIVRNSAVERVPVGGTFQADARGAEALLAMLKDGMGLAIKREDGHVYIDVAPPPSH